MRQERLSTMTGKCSTCEGIKHLDEMVRKEGHKGIYHCIDCEVETYNSLESELFSSLPSNELSPLSSQNKINKLMRWCFG